MTDSASTNPDGSDQQAVYRRSGVIMRRSRPEIERFFDGLELVEPGVQSLPPRLPRRRAARRSSRGGAGQPRRVRPWAAATRQVMDPVTRWAGGRKFRVVGDALVAATAA